MQHVAIVGAAGKMGSWFTSYFAHRGLDVSAFDINQKMLKPSGKVKIQNNLTACVKDADFVLVCLPVQKTPGAIKECSRSMKDGAVIAEISSVKKKTFAALKKTPLNLHPLCIHPMFGPGTNKTVETRMLLVPVRNEKLELKIAHQIFENSSLNVLSDAKEHDKAIAIVLGLTYFANIVFAKMMSSSNISVLKQVSGTTFGLQSLIAESILTEEPDLIIALIGENVYAKRYIHQYLKEAKSLARLTTAKQRADLKGELQKVKLSIQKKQDLQQSYQRMYSIIHDQTKDKLAT
ncbi:MAG TPA: prephenate dehydrogenase/arogenate dehydrogenase family protein [Nitrososphaera sp.]|nr:prephenate dehydrogenase/arogenate dehydrogenase family protein [Nitrososphaera sp.]